jgi:DNA-binding transcriptional MerR regulator
MIDKAPDAFRTISEAAEDIDLPQHVLRFWETRFSQIKPLKRGGGRRYYRPDDIEFLRGLKHLLHQEKYTIKGVQKIIKDQGVKAVQAAWKGGVPVATAPRSAAEAIAMPRSAAPARPAAAAPVFATARPAPTAKPTLPPLQAVSGARPALHLAVAELEQARRVLAAALA